MSEQSHEQLPAARDELADEKGPHDYDRILIEHIHSLHGVTSAAPLIESQLDTLRSDAQKPYSEYIKNYGEITLSGEITSSGQQGLTLYGSEFAEYRRFYRDYWTKQYAYSAVVSSTLVTLVSLHDGFLGRLVRATYRGDSNSFFKSKKSFDYSELSKLGTLDDARERILEHETDMLMRESHIEQLKAVDKNFGTTISDCITRLEEFTELTNRRNLIVHTNGVVSRQYVQATSQLKTLKELPRLGERVKIDREYLEDACDTLIEVAVKTTFMIWLSNRFRGDKGECEESLVLVILELVTLGRFRIASSLAEDALARIKCWHSDLQRRMLYINQAQALKWSGDHKACVSLLEDEDWSSSSRALRLACAVLRDDFHGAVDHMVNIGADDDVVLEEAYSDWPIFREFRKSQEFLDGFRGVFGKDFDSTRIGPDS